MRIESDRPGRAGSKGSKGKFGVRTGSKEHSHVTQTNIVSGPRDYGIRNPDGHRRGNGPGVERPAGGWHSFAAGSRAQAVHEGAFVWGDSTAADIYSGNENAFIVRANGGIWLGRATAEFTPTIASGVFISTSTGAYLTGGAWTNVSDHASKEAFELVDDRAVLLRLAELPIETRRYRAEETPVRHMGPVAQEF